MKILLVLLLCMLAIVQPQMGGGGSSRSRSYSKSIKSTKSKDKLMLQIYIKYLIYKNFNFDRNTTQFSKLQSPNFKKNLTVQIKSLMFILVIIGYYLTFESIYKKKFEPKKRIQQINRIIDQFQKEIALQQCILSLRQRQQKILQFLQKNWRIEYNQSSKCYYMTLGMISLDKKTNQIYKFQMTSQDSLGSSKSRGILSFQNENIALFFQKTYNNRQKAKQTGSFNILLYKGVFNNNKLTGQWYFNRYKDQPNNSGTWKMIQSNHQI